MTRKPPLLPTRRCSQSRRGQSHSQALCRTASGLPALANPWDQEAVPNGTSETRLPCRPVHHVVSPDNGKPSSLSNITGAQGHASPGNTAPAPWDWNGRPASSPAVSSATADAQLHTWHRARPPEVRSILAFLTTSPEPSPDPGKCRMGGPSPEPLRDPKGVMLWPTERLPTGAKLEGRSIPPWLGTQGRR